MGLPTIDPLIAGGVVLSTTLTDAVYVFFNAAVSARRRFARGDVEQRLVSARRVCGHQLQVELGACAAALGSWIGSFVSIMALDSVALLTRE
jgi:hypothetical protein